MLESHDHRRSVHAATRARPSTDATVPGRTLSALALVGVMMAVSLVGLADDEQTDWESSGDPLAEQYYSDPWGTEYEDPFADHDAEEDEAGPDRLRLYDRDGRRTGRVERDPIGDGRYSLYDDRGRRTGRVEEDPIVDDSYTVYDDRGRRVREIRKSPFLDGQYDVYDKTGRPIGRIQESPIVDGQFDIYDEKGRRIGRVEGD